MMKRNLHGIFLLDKPLGGSSNHALQRVKRLFYAEKAGHTGSLDPLATGMLPICFGEATKYSQHLLDANKIYEVTAQLGVRTDTGDSEGQIISQCECHATYDDIVQILPKFTGEIQQIPPMHSALKHKGRPLYEYARKGETIDRPARTVIIYALDLIHQTASTISLRVHCSKGTYIRSLIDDIGEELGCGAHVTVLRRTMVEPFDAYPMISLDELEASTDRDRYLLPLDAALIAWPKYILDELQVKRLLQGLPLFLEGQAGLVRFYSASDSFLGVGEIAEKGEVKNKRLVSTSATSVFKNSA